MDHHVLAFEPRGPCPRAVARRRVVGVLAAGACAVLGWAALRAPEAMLRWRLARFTAADPLERLAAARGAGRVVPWVSAAAAPALVRAFEEGARGMVRVSPVGTSESDPKEVRFYDLAHVIRIHPDFRAPVVFLSDEDTPPPPQVWWCPFDGEELLAELPVPGDFDGASVLGGKVSIRAPPEIHERIEAILSFALGGAELFNAVFDPRRSDRHCVGLLRAIAANPDANPWLRGCARRAAEGVEEALKKNLEKV